MMPRGLELDFCQREGDFLFRSGIISSTAYAMIWFRTTEIFRKLAHRCKIVNSYGEDRSTEGIALLRYVATLTNKADGTVCFGTLTTINRTRPFPALWQEPCK